LPSLVRPFWIGPIFKETGLNLSFRVRADLPEGKKLPHGINISFFLHSAPAKLEIAIKWIRDI